MIKQIEHTGKIKVRELDPDTKEVIIQSFPIFIDPDVAYSE